MVEQFTRKIGRNRGKPRLWIEGKVLLDAGFPNGAHWTLSQHGKGLTIYIDPEGKRRIAGTPDRPIIDIAGASLGLVGGMERVSITYQPGNGRMVVVEDAA